VSPRRNTSIKFQDKAYLGISSPRWFRLLFQKLFAYNFSQAIAGFFSDERVPATTDFYSHRNNDSAGHQCRRGYLRLLRRGFVGPHRPISSQHPIRIHPRHLVEFWAKGEEVSGTMPRKGTSWTSEADDALRSAVLAGNPLSVLSEKLGRSKSSIKSRAYILRLSLRSNSSKPEARSSTPSERLLALRHSISLSQLGLKAKGK
jgi:hypothetical protein